MARRKVIVMGAAGRDFHNFNTLFREDPDVEVVAFTATQIPDIEGRTYPPALAGSYYPKGIPIHTEEELPGLIRDLGVDEVWFSYSDVSNDYLVGRGALVTASGAHFGICSATRTMLASSKPVIAITAVRTGVGKSQTTRYLSRILKELGMRVVAVRHPMPYGDLERQICQRFATYEDLDKHECTIEEREEYEPHIDNGVIVYAGVDYEAILREAEKEVDVVLWDGGNNDFAFYKPDLMITVADPLRPGHEKAYYPGEVNIRVSDVVVINKVDTANPEDIIKVRESVHELNPNAIIIEGASPIYVDDPEAIRGKRVLVVEDGPTLTHGGMKIGAGWVAARRFGAAEIVDPRPFAVGEILATYKKYPDTGNILPAMGYGEQQVRDLEKTIEAADVDMVVIGTPIDLTRVMKINRPSQRVRYELEEIGKPDLEDILKKKFGK